MELTLNEALEGALRQSEGIQASAQQIADFATAQNISSNAFTGFYADAIPYLQLMFDARAVPGIVDFARDQFGDPTKDYNSWSVALTDATQAYVTALFNDYPTASATAGDWLQERKLTATGIDTRVFTPAESATLIGLLQAIADVPPLRE